MKNHNKKKKILILTCARGGKGHIMPALSIKQALEKKYKSNINIKIVDIYDYLSLRGSKSFNNTYIFFSKYIPFIVKIGFNFSNSKLIMNIITYSHYLNYGKRLRKLYEKEKPDLVLNNFPHWQYLSWLIWNKYYPNKPFVSLVTDSMSVHHGWTMGKIRDYIVADDETKKQLMLRGVKPKFIKVFGIPVSLDFDRKVDKNAVLKKIGLSRKIFTCLFLLNSKEDEKIIKFIKKSLSQINLILVSGRNENLLPIMKSFADSQTVIIGWTNKMYELINASDLVITKAGGSTIAECLAAQKPMIIYKIIPGQEEGNAKFILKKQLGLLQKNYRLIPRDIEAIRSDYRAYKVNLKKNKKAKSAEKIADYLIEILDF